ncbi:alpha-crystallin B chain-like [Pectinophora gossypiella]|uniref:alpha-crystallin B chain-like n=1 Tax=Pectinophora gossypiella TaxID=13191 RepID=UPI00214EF685|nr:alpha-crystallin B chain-like [Pectinophora gossypiella]
MAAPKIQDNVLAKTITIQRTDLSTFDDSFSFLREKFDAEMRRMDEAMNKFSSDLQTLYGQQGTSAQVGTALTSDIQSSPTWDSLVNSPLIQGEGTDKMLKLQFDLSQFDPAEIKVQIAQDILTVQATHNEQTDSSTLTREFKREFLLPRGTNPDAVISSLSRDGVLTVQAPLPQLIDQDKPKKQESKVLSKGQQNSQRAPKPDKTVPKPAAAEEAKTTPPAAQLPQSPLSSVSPAAPGELPQPQSPRTVSKMGSKTSKK